MLSLEDSLHVLGAGPLSGRRLRHFLFVCGFLLTVPSRHRVSCLGRGQATRVFLHKLCWSHHRKRLLPNPVTKSAPLLPLATLLRVASSCGRRRGLKSTFHTRMSIIPAHRGEVTSCPFVGGCFWTLDSVSPAYVWAPWFSLCPANAVASQPDAVGLSRASAASSRLAT